MHFEIYQGRRGEELSENVTHVDEGYYDNLERGLSLKGFRKLIEKDKEYKFEFLVTKWPHISSYDQRMANFNENFTGTVTFAAF